MFLCDTIPGHPVDDDDDPEPTCPTLKDCAYQFFTLTMDGISLRWPGNSSSSLTRWAKRIGSSSRNKDTYISIWKVYKETLTLPCRNWLALNIVPFEGRGPIRVYRQYRCTRTLALSSITEHDHLSKRDSRLWKLCKVLDLFIELWCDLERH